MSRFYTNKNYLLLVLFSISILWANAQGNRLSIQCTGPDKLSICGVNDSASIAVYNISSGTVAGIIIKLNLAPGIRYVKGTVTGASIAEYNVTNLNQPEFSAPNLTIARNFNFKVLLSSDCGLLAYLSGNSTPSILARIDYTGNFDVGSSIPFQVKVPSVQYAGISNLSFTGDIGSKFSRVITIGNYGKGQLREIKLIRINGKDLKTYKVNKGNTIFSGDTITTTFNSAFFKSIGNLDTFLDQNEVITIEDSSIVNGCQFLNTAFELNWGCGGSVCQVSKTSGSVLISNKVPNLKALPFPSFPTCYNNAPYKTELRFVNIGNMPAINPKVSISLNYPYVFSTFDTSSIRIKIGTKGKLIRPIKDSTTGTYNQGYYGCIGLFPIGFFRILAPVLNPNDTLFITWNTESCTVPACSNTTMLLNSWAYSATYKDQCKNTRTFPWTWGRVYDQHYFASSSFIPTDLNNQETGEFRTFISSASILPMANNSNVIVDIILPKGLTHNKLKKDLYFINADLNANWNPDSIVQIGDTLRGYFPTPIPISLTNAELVYYLKADCSKPGANGNQTIGLQIKYNPDKNCNPKEWLYLTCQTMQVKIHCFSNCAGGMKFRDFSVRRISFGQPDNNNDGAPDNSGVLDTLKIREERCLFGDTILAEFTGSIKRSSSIISWRNAYIETNINNGRFLDVAGIELLVWRRGVTLSVTCNQILYWKTVSGNNALFKIDLSTDSMSSCVSSSFRYSNDDSLIVKVKFRVSGNIGGATQNLIFTNRFYTSNINNPSSNSNKFQCDTFSGQMILSGYYFTTCCNDLYQANSCNQIVVNNYYYLGIGACCSNYGGNNYFPFEYRNFARLKAIRYYLPQGYKMRNSLFMQIRTSGSNKTTAEYKDSIKPINPNSNPIVYEVSKYYKDSANGKINFSDDAFHGYYLAYMEPSCEIQSLDNVPIKYDFIFERKNTFGSGFDTVGSGNADYIVYNKPVTTVKPSSPIIYAASDTAEWEVVYTNYSASFSNINTWFAPDNSGAIKIVQIKDMPADTVIPSLNSVFRAGLVPYNQTRKFKVRAIYNSCKKDSIVLYTGWNCLSYPKDLASYNCLKERIVLYLEPQNTQYESTLSDSIKIADLCASTPYTLTIENTGATKGYNTKAYINLPIGMTVESGSCYVQYPHKGSKTAIPLPTLKSGTLFEWNLSALNNLVAAGFSGVNDTNKNKIIIHFKVKTDCDYSSGNYIRAGGIGNIKCGDPVLSYSSISNPLNIKGVTRPYYTLLKTESDSIFPCSKSSKVRIKIINLGPDKTGIEDKYQAVLLPGMIYDSTLYNGEYQFPDNNLTKIRNINGASEIEFSLPANVVPGDSMAFEFGFTSDGKQLDCGNIDLYGQTAVKQEVVCIADNSKCKINVVTGNNLLKVPVLKSEIGFSQLKAKLIQTSSDSETLSLSFNVFNAGSKINVDKPIIFHYQYDKNASGTADPGDVIAYTDTVFLELDPNESVVLNKIVKLRSGQSCALFIALDSGTCSCQFASARFPIPALKNAGISKSVCSGDTIQLGGMSIKGFSYLWIPGAELENDTLSQSFLYVQNTDTATVKKQFILTTYRGQCNSKDTVQIEVYKLPEILLFQKDSSICEGEKVILKAGSRSGTGAHSILWKPSIFLSNSSSYTPISSPKTTTMFKAKVTDSKMCISEDSLLITVQPRPKAKFVSTAACEKNKMLLKDSTILIGDTIGFIRWRSESLDTTGVSFLDYPYYGKNTSSMKLEVRSSFGCIDSFRKTLVFNPLPKPIFQVKNVCFGDSISTLSTSSVSSGSIVKTYWKTGDGTVINGNSIKYKYQKADTFYVSLHLETDKQCMDSGARKVIVYPRPTAAFTVAEACQGDSSLTANNSIILNDSIVSYTWRSDQDTIYSKAAVFYFQKDTLHRIELLTESSKGCRDSLTMFALVNPNPKANFNLLDVCETYYSNSASLSTISKGSISSYAYDLEDGFSYTTKDFSHRFLFSDTFDIRLIVTSNKGCKDSTVKKHVVHPRLYPDFISKNICITDSLFILDNSRSPKTNISNWTYHFSPIDSSTLKDPRHQYSKAGTYAIRLKVRSSEGCEYDTSKTLIVFPLPIPDFSDSNRCFDNRFSFVSNIRIDTGFIKQILWDFADGSFAIDSNPIHSFPNAGKYWVKLIATSDFGCKDSIDKEIESFPPVFVDFVAQNVCLGDPVVFTDKSITPNTTVKAYRWDFGDGDSATTKDSKHIYLSDGQYTVNLRILSAYDCFYDSSKSVQVYPVPKAMFSTDKDIGSIVEPEITISDLSFAADTIKYDLGDGNWSYMRNLMNSYPDSGTYWIKQYASNLYGCRDTFTKKIIIKYMFVFNAPTAFSPNQDGINDVYLPGGIGIQAFQMQIFNRWGEMVFISENNNGWDGTYMGEEVMEGVYAASFKVKDFNGRWHYLSSSFVLLR